LSSATLSIGRSVKRILPSRDSAPTINHSMQYARRQRAKGRRPLINSAALPGQKAAPTDLMAQPPAQRLAIEITALLGALSNTREPARAAEGLVP
jgi:hypothetical protein